MSHDGEYGWSGDVPPDIASMPADVLSDVPAVLDVLPDGRETVVIGDVDGLADFTHPQGDNPFGFLGTCGLCSCECILRQFGIEVTEADVVEHAIDHGECHISDDPTACGGTTVGDQVAILGDYGVPAHYELGGSLEDLAASLEQGRGVIIEANAGVLWDDVNAYDNGQINHAVVATGVARDPSTGEIQGFYVNDSGTGEAGRFVDAATMREAWMDPGGVSVVTDIVRAGTPASGTSAG